MPTVYVGRAFRQRHGISQQTLAEGAGLRAATLADLENARNAPRSDTLGRIIAYFRRIGIACDVGDLLTYEDEDPDGRRNSNT